MTYNTGFSLSEKAFLFFTVRLFELLGTKVIIKVIYNFIYRLLSLVSVNKPTSDLLDLILHNFVFKNLIQKVAFLFLRNKSCLVNL